VVFNRELTPTCCSCPKIYHEYENEILRCDVEYMVRPHRPSSPGTRLDGIPARGTNLDILIDF